MSEKKLKVHVAGASGFIGSKLIQVLQKDYDVVGLSRSEKKGNGIKWIQADLFSYQSTLQALEGCDIAIYLVHSMLPSTRLFQGSFKDTDLFLADNFAKACKENNVKQIVYLGGLVPEGYISEHLKSRKEVEEVFQYTQIPVTVIRAGMIVGDGGSSFEILKNIVHNLPGMVLPEWTQSQTQAIYIDDLIAILARSISNQDFYHEIINAVNGEEITYEKMIRETADFLGKKRILINVPINYTSFSKLWVKTFGQTDYELVSPLIDSLRCDLKFSKPEKKIQDLVRHPSFKSMLSKVSKSKSLKKREKNYKKEKTVRSIQRLENPSSFNVLEISHLYVKWLSQKFQSFIHIEMKEDQVHFIAFRFSSKPLLILERVRDSSILDRVKFNISGGLLSDHHNNGWLEFRSLVGGKYTLVSINEFVPSLPWPLYKYGQAIAHLEVMKAFNSYLSKLKV